MNLVTRHLSEGGSEFCDPWSTRLVWHVPEERRAWVGSSATPFVPQGRATLRVGLRLSVAHHVLVWQLDAVFGKRGYEGPTIVVRAK